MLTRSDILAIEEFEKIRLTKKGEIRRLKNVRIFPVGPDITFHFENVQTIWWQIQEMLRIEKGGQDQIDDELSAYNPLIPRKKEQSYELSATMMIEIVDPERRRVMLQQLYGINDHINIEYGDITFPAFSADDSEDRNREFDKKTSSVHFLKWLIPADNISNFLNGDTYLAIDHPFYSFKNKLSDDLKNSFKVDFESME